MTLILHQKEGKTHGYLILPEWQEDHVLSSQFSWMRLEKIARLEEIRLGHPLVAGRHDKAIAQALRKNGKICEAEQIKTDHDEEFAALAHPRKREEWLSKHFKTQNRVKHRQIYEWNENHRLEKEQARLQISLFRSLLDSKPFSSQCAELMELKLQVPFKTIYSSKRVQMKQKTTIHLCHV